MKKVSFVLASQSPQRGKILEALKLKFISHPAHVDEHHSGLQKPHAIVKSIALRKAMKVAELYPERWVIGCDTIVALSDERIALKPEDREDARKTLKTYQGSYCQVYSGLALVNLSRNIQQADFDRTRLNFKHFSNQALEDHLKTGRWKMSSGSLTIEDKMDWIESIEGDYWNVVGLPVALFKKMLLEADLI